MKTIEQLVRPNILELKPYTSARTEYKGLADILLDANENPFESGVNRYPDPLQVKLKKQIGQIKNIDPDHIFLGNGSDEVIDLLLRIFCEPKEDHIIILPPTYGMYKVSASISNVDIKTISLLDNFQPDVEQILKEANAHSKILFICNPNNPTGNAISFKRIEQLVKGFEGIVVIDEAYIDFSIGNSALQLLPFHKNLVVMQTFSKAWGLAGIRLGMAFADPAIIHFFNKVKPPYNINTLTQDAALTALNQLETKKEWVKNLVEQRNWVTSQLENFSFVKKVYDSDTNFILVKVDDPNELYQYLIGQKIIVRNRSTTHKCEGCLRFTVGTSEENDRLIQALKEYR